MRATADKPALARRLRRALAVSLLAFAAAASPAAGATLSPDLKTLKIRDVSVGPDAGGRELRFTNEVGNGAAGPLEVDPVGKVDCNDDGDTTNDRLAFQRLYRDPNGDGLLDRETESDYRLAAAGCMAFHPAHSHWHFNDFARYTLRRNSNGNLMAGSTKVSFCMLDSYYAFPSVPGSSDASYFDSCAPSRSMGISPGWSDIYGADLADQDLDVTGLSDGWYCLESAADPDGRLRETVNANNARRLKLKLIDGGVDVSKRDCSPEAGG